LAESSWEDKDHNGLTTAEHKHTLYQTRGGAFFVDEETTQSVWNERERETETKTSNTFIPMSPEQAHKWMMTGEVEVFRSPFELPPEAEAEAEPGSTIYIRVPAALKSNVDKAARAAKVSGNVWAMRCLEQCLEKPDTPEDKPTEIPEDLYHAWWIASNFRVYAKAKDTEWKREECIEALSEIAGLIENAATELCLSDMSHGPTIDRIQEYRKYEPYK
jgi:predicted HicB family RNase H-like nuclease